MSDLRGRMYAEQVHFCNWMGTSFKFRGGNRHGSGKLKDGRITIHGPKARSCWEIKGEEDAEAEPQPNQESNKLQVNYASDSFSEVNFQEEPQE